MKKKFFIIAGEPSGDVLGGKIIAEIKNKLGDEAEFVGVGGKMMAEQGLSSIFDISDISVMGFSEVLCDIFTILKRIKQTAQAVLKEEPDYVITIDSPDFCFRVMKKLKNFKKAKKIHMIAPSVWAYREGRAKKIAKLYDLLLTILPFEPPYFTKHGLKTEFIGHPIVENKPNFAAKSAISKNFRKKHGFYENDTVLYVTPGSRISEVERIFPEFIIAINLLTSRVENLSVVIGAVDKTKEFVLEMAKNLEVKNVVIGKNEKEDAFFASDFSLAKSGTNTIESSLYRLPMIICYKVSALTYYIARALVKIKFANLVNLILDRMVIPELLQKNCDAQIIAKNLEYLIKNPELAKKQIDESQSALRVMGLEFDKKPSERAAEEILNL